MHISEGVLKPEIIVPCSALCVVLVSSLIYKLKTSEIPKVAAVSAMFFMASFIHVPIGVTSIHLVLSGLAGAFLGANAVLAIFIALFFQALLFGYGGLSALGVNLLIIASPALLSPYLLKLSFKRYRLFFWFLIGFLPILCSSALLSLTLVLNGKEFAPVAALVFTSNLALMALEGIISLFALSFIFRVKKDLLIC